MTQQSWIPYNPAERDFIYVTKEVAVLGDDKLDGKGTATWIPAFARMTEGAGITSREGG